MNGKWTPGPWTLKLPGGVSVWKRFPGNKQWSKIATPSLEVGMSERAANARLIAAAPDMAEAIEELIVAIRKSDFYGGEDDRVNNATSKARAALAKARGEGGGDE